MRKIILAVLAVILCLILVFMLVNKISIGNFEILGIKGLLNKNEELDAKIEKANEAYTNIYNTSLAKLNASSETLKKQKEEYDKYIMEVSQNSSLANQIQSYEIEYLWTKIGNYASNQGVVLKMEVVTNNSSLNTYDLNFTATGKYVSITEFIYKLENDSSLLFKIENFNLVSDSTDGTQLKATFVCKDVSINLDQSLVTKTTTNTTNTDSTANNTTTNTTNTDSTANKTTDTSTTNNTTSTDSTSSSETKTDTTTKTDE